MSKRSVFSYFLLCLLSIACRADIVFDSNTTPAPFLRPGLSTPKDIDMRGNWSFQNGIGRNPGVFCIFSKPIPVDPEKSYTLSGEFRIFNAQSPIKGFNFAFQPRDAANRSIFVHEVFVVPDSPIGILADDVLDGDTEIFIEGVSWEIPYAHWVVAFDVKEDMSDLPNRNCSPRIIKGNSVLREDVLQLQFSRPLQGSYPKGTKVRLHSDGPTYQYVAQGAQPGEEWVKWSGVIRGMHPAGKIGPDKWYQGTKSANIIFRCFDAGMTGATFEFRNIQVEENIP